MNSKLENNTLTILPEGRIDSANAAAVEAEIEQIISANTFNAFVIDAENLLYISSAGLRVVLRLCKRFSEFKVINASPEVYDIFDMTGFDEIMTVEKAYRKLSVDGCTIIGKGAKGTVYRYNGDTIVKVYNNPDSLDDIHRERTLAKKAFVLGIPTAISYDVVKVDGKYGSVFELLDAKSFSQIIAEEPDKLEEYAGISADLLKQIHETEVKPEDMPDVRILVNKWISAIEPYVAPEVFSHVKTLVDNAPECHTMIHGDYHTNNIMMQNGEALLIDMDTLSYGLPVFELANVHITYVGLGEKDPEVVGKFLGLPYEMAVKIWDSFIRAYLGTEDEAAINEAEDKIRLFSYIRLLRHNVRRGAADTEEGMAELSRIASIITELSGRVESL